MDQPRDAAPTYENVYVGDEYADARTRVTCETEVGPGGGRHRYCVAFEDGTDSGSASVAYIGFQTGPVKEVGINGIQDEGLLAVLIDRLKRFQAGPYSCFENQMALTKLQEAHHWMEARKRDRIARDVEGRNKA